MDGLGCSSAQMGCACTSPAALSYNCAEVKSFQSALLATIHPAQVKISGYQTRTPLPALSTVEDQIRILELDPGANDDLLVGHLRLVSLEDNTETPYEAVSYAWGDPSVVSTALIDGQETTIPRSASEALKQIRFPNQIRRVFIDAICVNQVDATERGHQVALMGKVYPRTSRTLICLGEDDGTFDKFLELSDIILNEIKREIGETENLADYLVDSFPKRSVLESFLRLRLGHDIQLLRTSLVPVSLSDARGCSGSKVNLLLRSISI